MTTVNEISVALIFILSAWKFVTNIVLIACFQKIRNKLTMLYFNILCLSVNGLVQGVFGLYAAVIGVLAVLKGVNSLACSVAVTLYFVGISCETFQTLFIFIQQCLAFSTHRRLQTSHKLIARIHIGIFIVSLIILGVPLMVWTKQWEEGHLVKFCDAKVYVSVHRSLGYFACLSGISGIFCVILFICLHIKLKLSVRKIAPLLEPSIRSSHSALADKTDINLTSRKNQDNLKTLKADGENEHYGSYDNMVCGLKADIDKTENITPEHKAAARQYEECSPSIKNDTLKVTKRQGKACIFTLSELQSGASNCYRQSTSTDFNDVKENLSEYNIENKECATSLASASDMKQAKQIKSTGAESTNHVTTVGKDNSDEINQSPRLSIDARAPNAGINQFHLKTIQKALKTLLFFLLTNTLLPVQYFVIWLIFYLTKPNPLMFYIHAFSFVLLSFNESLNTIIVVNRCEIIKESLKDLYRRLKRVILRQN